MASAGRSRKVRKWASGRSTEAKIFGVSLQGNRAVITASTLKRGYRSGTRHRQAPADMFKRYKDMKWFNISTVMTEERTSFTIGKEVRIHNKSCKEAQIFSQNAGKSELPRFLKGFYLFKKGNVPCLVQASVICFL